MTAATTEQEIRALFAAWSKESAAKDIDATMSHIAPDVVSFEHDAPLQYLGVDAVREVCQHGFDLSPDDLHWDVEQLQILSRDDIAVAWGLNHMHGVEPDGARMESYSRGTWVFQKLGQDWKLIHQHVSYPYDPETGAAITDLTPE